MAVRPAGSGERRKQRQDSENLQATDLNQYFLPILGIAWLTRKILSKDAE